MKDYCKAYGYTPDKEKIQAHLDHIAQNLESAATPAVLKQCFGLMDLTTLHNTDTPSSVTALMEKVNECKRQYPDYPLPASVCVFPNFVPIVKKVSHFPELHATSVAGCFPASQSFIEVKEKECEMSVLAGADEVDIVLALNAFCDGDYARAAEEVRRQREAIDKAAASVGRRIVLKVILETGLLVAPEAIAQASLLAMEAGADFIKTSTGKVEVNATPMAAYVMCEAILAFYKQTGRKVGFKAAGGVSSALDAVCYHEIVKAVLGEEWLCPELFRLGVSRLANSLMSAIEQKTVKFF